MEFAVAALLGRATRGVTLDNVDFTQRWVFFLAVGQLAGQAHAVEHTFAPRHLPRFARGLSSAGGVDDLAANDLGVVGALLQIVPQHLAHNVFDWGAYFARYQFVFGLTGELGLGHFHRQHAAQAFAHVVPGHLDLGLFSQVVLFNVFVDHPRHRRAQAGQVGAAITLGDVVGEAQYRLVVAVIPLHGDFHANVGAGNAAIGFCGALALGVKRIGVQNFFTRVDELHKTGHATRARVIVTLASALIQQADAHTVVQVAEFAQTLAQNLVMKIVVLDKDVGVGQEMHFGAALVGLACDAHGRDFHAIDHFQQPVLHKAFGKLNRVHLAVTTHHQTQPFRECVHARHAHAV